MPHVSHAATTITRTDLGPTMCGSVGSPVASTINSMPFVTKWT